MKRPIEKREPQGLIDYIALALTTFGVGYLPLAPGTWGSAVGVGIYLSMDYVDRVIGAIICPKCESLQFVDAWVHSINSIGMILLCLVGIWAAGRSTSLFGNSDPSQAVVDEVQGQLITFLFIPFTYSWKYVLAGFLLFRLFDIWKPYPIDDLQDLPAGIGVCADDIVAGVYAGVCLSIIYAIGLAV